MKKMVEWWREAASVAALAVVIWQFQVVKGDAEEAKTIMQQQADINSKLAALIEDGQDKTRDINTKLQVYLTVYGFDDSIAREWATYPRSPVMDSTGTPAVWTPWLQTDSALQIGVRYMFDDSGKVLVDTLWKFTRAKK